MHFFHLKKMNEKKNQNLNLDSITQHNIHSSDLVIRQKNKNKKKKKKCAENQKFSSFRLFGNN